MEDSTQLEKLLGEWLKVEMAEAESFSEIERIARERLQEIGRVVMGKMLTEEGTESPAITIACCCGAEASYVRQREATLRTVMGKVKYERAYYVCGICRKGVYPLDEQLGLKPNAMSGELERLAGMMGVERPFAQGSRLMEEMLLVSLSDHSLDKAAQVYGEEQMQRETQWQQDANDPDCLLEQKRTARAPRRLYGSMDGGRVHIRGEEGVQDAAWRELKVGAWFRTYARPPASPEDQWSIRAKDVHYYADICEAEEFGRLMWATGFQHHAQLAEELIMLGDGARWIWDLVDQHYPQAIQIVDWFHACEYLAPVAHITFTHNEERERWIQQMKTALWQGQLDTVIAACQKHVDPNREKDPAQQAVTYYTNNRHRMHYPTYRANGYQIGSGTIESGIKQIGTQRMKVPGAFWNLASARKVSKARAAYLSDQWNQLAARRYHLNHAA